MICWAASSLIPRSLKDIWNWSAYKKEGGSAADREQYLSKQTGKRKTYWQNWDPRSVAVKFGFSYQETSVPMETSTFSASALKCMSYNHNVVRCKWESQPVKEWQKKQIDILFVLLTFQVCISESEPQVKWLFIIIFIVTIVAKSISVC